jgi:hypothetical protein
MPAKPNRRRPFRLVVGDPPRVRKAEGVAPWLRAAVAERAHLPDDQIARFLGVQQQHVQLTRRALELEGDEAA